VSDLSRAEREQAAAHEGGMSVPALAWKVALASSQHASRRVLLVDLLSKGQYLSVARLARKLRVSKATVERDLRLLGVLTEALESVPDGEQKKLWRLGGAP
jgi:Fic family protein